jgi:hypothetical protein
VNTKHVLFMASAALVLLGCNAQTEIKPATLGIGATGIAQRINGQSPTTGTLESNPVTTQQTGSVLLVSLARGAWASAPNAPTDNHANTFALQGSTHTYIDWTSSATGLYHAIGASGGANHVFSMLWNNSDEVSLSAVEVKGATTIEDSRWVERPAANSISSASVHTNGAAMLIAWWWGSGGVRTVGETHKAIPGNGFTLIPNATGLVSLSGSGYIQVAAAYRMVSAAGDYNVTWQTDNEGAQLYLVALR